ncbi:MAG: OpgC domain-containing protein [Campylobacterales bacterium]|nr:OpgC domain-containing protein [Campylobacterales bacterium]
MHHAPRIAHLDILRGFLLFMMILDHTPGLWRAYTFEPLGFVSAAEGFILISAYLMGQKINAIGSFESWRAWIIKRSKKLYVVHLWTLLFVYVVINAIATQSDAFDVFVYGMRDGGVLAYVSGLALLYHPPYLDILPTYIMLLLLSVGAVALAKRAGWGVVLSLSAALWVAAQAGLLSALAAALDGYVYLRLGVFDIFAWQFLWCVGLYFSIQGHQFSPAWSHPLSAAVLVGALIFYAARVPYSPLMIDPGVYAWLFAKKELGPLRLLDLSLLLYLFLMLRAPLKALGGRIAFFRYMGRHSLYLLGLHVTMAMLIEGSTYHYNLGSIYVFGLLCIQFGVMTLYIAYEEGRLQR